MYRNISKNFATAPAADTAAPRAVISHPLDYREPIQIMGEWVMVLDW